MPVARGMSRAASRMAESGTAMKAPSDSRTARSAFLQLRGSPTLMESAMVCEGPNFTSSALASNASTSGRAPWA